MRVKAYNKSSNNRIAMSEQMGPHPDPLSPEGRQQVEDYLRGAEDKGLQVDRAAVEEGAVGMERGDAAWREWWNTMPKPMALEPAEQAIDSEPTPEISSRD
jgi:DNA-binding LacI/PurR family transcriptional regulator